MKRIIILSIMSICLLHINGQELFNVSKLRTFSNPDLLQMVENSAYKQVLFGTVDEDVLNYEQLSVTLPETGSTTFYQLESEPDVWYGETPDKLNYISLVKDENVIVGNIVVDGNSYRINTFEDGSAVITEYDFERYPEQECHHPVINQASLISPMAMTPTSKPLRVLVAYTTAAAAKTSSIYADIRNAFLETHRTYDNSKITHRMELAACVKTTYTETTNIETDLTRFATKNDGYMDEIHTLRDRYAADICVLIVDNSKYSTTYGIARAIYASESQGFCVVSQQSASSTRYTFGHEIAHLVGCRHDNDTNTSPFAYGHGYIAGSYRTIMAQTATSRIPYYSSPDISYGGYVIGTTSKNNNARVLKEETERLKSFRTPSSSYTFNTLTIKSGEYGHGIATSQLTTSGTVTVESGGKLVMNAPSTITLKPGFTARSGSTVQITLRNPESSALAVNATIPFQESIDIYTEPFIESIAVSENDYSLTVAPNPVQYNATIKYNLPEDCNVTLSIISTVSGTNRILVNKQYTEKGEYEYNFEKEGLPTGIYSLVLTTDDVQKVTKIMIQ